MIFNNKTLKENLLVVLNEKIDSLTFKNIQEITNVRISTYSEENQHNENFNDLLYFENLQKVIVTNSLIKSSEIKVLSSIPTLSVVEFEHCIFANDLLLSSLNKIESLTLNNSHVRDYKFISRLNKLNKLEILNPCDETILDLSLLNKTPLLKKVYLERCILINFSSLVLPELEEISLLNTLVMDFSFINSSPKLNLMIISEKYLEDEHIRNNKNRINIKTNYIEYAFEEPETVKSNNVI